MTTHLTTRFSRSSLDPRRRTLLLLTALAVSCGDGGTPGDADGTTGVDGDAGGGAESAGEREDTATDEQAGGDGGGRGPGDPADDGGPGPGDPGADGPPAPGDGPDGPEDAGDDATGKSNGMPCSGNDNCASGFCADGLCCNTACTDVCQACHLAGLKGTCAPVVSAEDPDTCAGATACSGSAACRKKAGQTCAAGAECGSGFCTDGVCCNNGCTDPCRSCATSGAPGVCAPVVGMDDADTCSGTSTCDSGATCRKRSGQACGGGSECASTFCADAICCDSPCDGPCRSCALPGSVGSCSPVTGTLDAPGCVAPFVCDAAGTCKKDLGEVCSAGTECSSTFCVDGVCCESTCTAPCYTCSAHGRAGTCTAVGDAAGATSDPQCIMGGCYPGGVCKHDNGTICSTGAVCRTGFCADGVCCSGACTTACQRCDRGGSVGTCSSVTNADDADTCTGTSTCSVTGACKSKNGRPCSGPSDCASGQCWDGVCCATDCGAGACASCALPGKVGTCATVTGTPSRNCNGMRTCDALGVCKAATGESCSVAGDCASGQCADGACCSTSCTGSCLSCAIPGKRGTCSPVKNGADDSCNGGHQCDDTGACKAVWDQPCGADGDCVSGHCLYVDLDHDGYGTTTRHCANMVGEWGFATVGTDCCDLNATVNPGVTTFATVPYTCGPMPPSYDYDCSGAEEKENTTTINCLLPAAGGCGRAGWDAVPACGDPGVWRQCEACATGPAFCCPSSVSSDVRSEGCR